MMVVSTALGLYTGSSLLGTLTDLLEGQLEGGRTNPLWLRRRTIAYRPLLGQGLLMGTSFVFSGHYQFGIQVGICSNIAANSLPTALQQNAFETLESPLFLNRHIYVIAASTAIGALYCSPIAALATGFFTHILTSLIEWYTSSGQTEHVRHNATIPDRPQSRTEHVTSVDGWPFRV